MEVRDCPKCRSSNPAENRYCGNCGSPLRYHVLAPEDNTRSLSGPSLPLEVDAKRLARTLAISLGALVAEAAVLHLRRRIRDELNTLDDQPQSFELPRKAGLGMFSGVAMMVMERQLVEIKDGRPVRRLIERHVWRKDIA